MNRPKPSCLVLLACAVLTVPAVASDGGQLRKQRFPATVHVGDLQLAGARFEVACHPARDGSLSISLVLAKTDTAAGFAQDCFEGPDGIGEQREFARWSVDTRTDGLNVKGPISGWYGVDGDGFIFSRSQPNGRSGALSDLVEAAIAPEARRLRLSIDAPDTGAALQAELMLDGIQAAIRDVAGACLP
jgi:hypothetical protein